MPSQPVWLYQGDLTVIKIIKNMYLIFKPKAKLCIAITILIIHEFSKVLLYSLLCILNVLIYYCNYIVDIRNILQ